MALTGANTLNAGYSDANSLIGKSRSKGIKSLEQGAKEAQPYYQQGVQAFQPYNQTGQTLNALYGNAIGANGATGNAAATSAFQTSPGYQFNVDQGLQAILRNGAATGGVANGNVLSALQGRGTDLANQEYQQWLDNLYRGAGQGIQGAQGMASELNQIGGLHDTLGQNKAQVQIGTYGNQASLAQQQAAQLAQMQQAQSAQDQSFWNNLITGGLTAGSKLLGTQAGGAGGLAGGLLGLL